MISLEQIRLLEAKIIKAVERMRALKAENTSLRRTLDSAQLRMQDLEKLVDDLKTDQKEIEQSILRAMENLDQLEDEVADSTGVSEPRGKKSYSSKAHPRATGPAPPGAGAETSGSGDAEPQSRSGTDGAPLPGAGARDEDSPGAGEASPRSEPSGDDASGDDAGDDDPSVEAGELDIF